MENCFETLDCFSCPAKAGVFQRNYIFQNTEVKILPLFKLSTFGFTDCQKNKS